MHEGRFIFSQLMEFLPTYEYNKCVRRYRGNPHSHSGMSHVLLIPASLGLDWRRAPTMWFHQRNRQRISCRWKGAT